MTVQKWKLGQMSRQEQVSAVSEVLLAIYYAKKIFIYISLSMQINRFSWLQYLTLAAHICMIYLTGYG